MAAAKVVLFVVLATNYAESRVTDEEYRLMPKTFHLDNFDDCMGLGEKALYCTATIQLGPSDSDNKSRTWNVIQNVIKDPRYYRHDLLRHGICVPETCPSITATNADTQALKDGISRCYSSKYESQGLKAVVANMHCQTDQVYYPIDNLDVAVGIVLGVIISIVGFATFYEGRARYKSKEEYDKVINTRTGRLIACFSLPKNWERLRLETANPDTEALKCLQGIRFFNLQLVILVHAAVCTLASSIHNPSFAENLTRRPENILLINGLAAIQTFLIVSGFLLSYNLHLTIGKGKPFQLRTILLAFINRYIRLTPCLIVMVALHSTWLYRIGGGPLWDLALGTEYRNCRQNWWTNLLYINNYYDAEHMCMQHAWYLATDTQLFIMSLIVIALMWISPKMSKVILTLAIVVGFTTPAIINYYNNYDIVIRMYPEALYSIFLKVPHWHAMYSSSLVNFGGYAVGVAFGYVYYKRRNQKVFTKKIYVAIWWVLSWGLPLSVIFYGVWIYKDNFEYTRIGAAVYVAVYRGLFALGMSIMIYGYIEGIGWICRDCLVWSPIEILGRLTYCMYLVHVPIIRVRGGQARLPSYITYYTMFTQTAGDALMALVFGTLLALFVELPVSALQKLTVPQVSEKRKNEHIEERTKKIDQGEEYNKRF